MKNATPDLDDLLLKINELYRLLETLNYSETFLRKYADYLDLAELIQNTSRKKAYNDLSSPVHFINSKVIPVLNIISENLVIKNTNELKNFSRNFSELLSILKKLPHFTLQSKGDKEEFLKAKFLYNKVLNVFNRNLDYKVLNNLNNTVGIYNFFEVLRKFYMVKKKIINIADFLGEANTINLHGSKNKLTKTDFALTDPSKFLDFETTLQREIDLPQLTKREFTEKLDKVQKILTPYISELLPTKNFLTIENNFYFYNGKNLQIEPGSHYDILLKTLYKILNGKSGEIRYKDYCLELAKNKKYKFFSNKQIVNLIQKYLTSKTDGIFTKIKPLEQNSIPLVRAIKNYGIRFNNN